MKRYTKAEDFVIRSNAKTKNAAQIADMLPGRTKGSVKRRAAVLKVSIKRNGERHYLSKYSDDDIEMCRKLHDAGMKPITIAEKMEMSYSYVRKIVCYATRR